MLYLVCCGEVGVDQDGRTARIGAGDLFIYDQSQPFTLEFGGYSRGIVLTIPRPLDGLAFADIASSDGPPDRRPIAAWRAHREHRTSDRRFRCRLGGGSRQSRERLRRSIFSRPRSRSSLPGALDDGAAYGGRLDQVKRYVLANLDDAGMTIETIASAHHVAPRTLHRLFSVEGTTPIRWLWQQRLTASYKALAEGRVRQVTDAALSFGFTDISHFSRAFKKQFGCFTAHTGAPIVA